MDDITSPPPGTPPSVPVPMMAAAPRKPISLWLYVPPLLNLLYGGSISVTRFFGSGAGHMIAWGALGVVLTILTIVSLVIQLKVIRVEHYRIYKLEILLASALTVLPTAAFVLADTRGALDFHNKLDSAPGLIAIFLIISISVAATTLSLGNVLLILGRANRAVKIIGAILYGIVWVALAIACYIIYGVEYSLHDPSTE